MVYEAPVPSLFEHVRLSSVAQRAGVTTGALYHYWESQEEYQKELLLDLISTKRYPIEGALADRLGDIGKSEMSILEVIRRVCIVNVEQFLNSQDFRVQLAVVVSDDAEAVAGMAEQYRDRAARWIEFYEDLFDTFDLVLREPFTFQWLATALTGLFEGLLVRHRLDPSSVPLGGTQGIEDEEWSLFSSTVVALLAGVAQPASEERVDLWLWATRVTAPLGSGSSVKPSAQ